jgi:endonuclease YncB( thermonuclease family)
MPFTLIKGTFHLVGRTSAGNPSGFEPDGDSIHFKPASPALLDGLTREGSAPRLSSIGSTQLRFEGVDALELHFEGTRQPAPMAEAARDFLTDRLDLDPVAYRPPKLIRVKPPVLHDGAPGYILSRALEVHGRPVSFVFAGQTSKADGAEVRLTVSLMKRSLNYTSLAAGLAYPLFYDTLFRELREAFAVAAATARTKRLGLWKTDLSRKGLPVADLAALEAGGVVFPKLFRRLVDYLKSGPGGTAAAFLPWLAATREQVLDLPAENFTHFDNVLAATADGKLRLTAHPEELVFISAKTPNPAVAPWLRH